jgi:hypothetical protein
LSKTTLERVGSAIPCGFNRKRYLKYLLFRIIIGFAAFLSPELMGGQDSIQTIESGDRTFQISLRDRSTSEHDRYDKILTITKQGREIVHVLTEGYLLEAFWSSENRFVAVNNRRANSGDYVWVFSLSDGRVLRKPPYDDGQAETRGIAAKLQKLFPPYSPGDIDGSLSLARGWKTDNDLVIETRLVYAGRNSGILRRAIYSATAKMLRFRGEEFEEVNWESLSEASPKYESQVARPAPRRLSELFVAVKERDQARLQESLNAGADPNQVADNGWTALHEAVFIGDIAIVRLLIEGGANVNARVANDAKGNSNQWTPLLLAISYNRAGIVSELLQRGADPNLPDARGITPLQLAREHNNDAIVKLLESAAPKKS